MDAGHLNIPNALVYFDNCNNPTLITAITLLFYKALGNSESLAQGHLSGS